MTFSQRAVEAAARKYAEQRYGTDGLWEDCVPKVIDILTAALAVDGVALVPKDALGVLMEKTEHFDDEGPLHEGWQSDELRGARAKIGQSLSAASEGEERR